MTVCVMTLLTLMGAFGAVEVLGELLTLLFVMYPKLM